VHSRVPRSRSPKASDNLNALIAFAEDGLVERQGGLGRRHADRQLLPPDALYGLRRVSAEGGPRPDDFPAGMMPLTAGAYYVPAFRFSASSLM
jgi:hypothetical protein